MKLLIFQWFYSFFHLEMNPEMNRENVTDQKYEYVIGAKNFLNPDMSQENIANRKMLLVHGFWKFFVIMEWRLCIFRWFLFLVLSGAARESGYLIRYRIMHQIKHQIGYKFTGPLAQGVLDPHH